jgi:hypothetical protein
LFWADDHWKGGDDEDTEHANCNAHERNRHPTNPFLFTKFRVSLEIEH